MEDSTSTIIFVGNVAYRLKLKRLQLRMTLLDVESLFSMKSPALSRLETGKQFFTIKTIIPLVEFYGLKPTEIFLNYTELPTRRDWQYLASLEDEMVSCKKSKGYREIKRREQLELEF